MVSHNRPFPDPGTGLVKPKPGAAGTICRDHCFANGLVMRAIRDTMVLAPPLIITEKQTELLLRKAQLCIDLTAKDLGIQ